MGALRRLPERTFLASVMLPVVFVMAARCPAHGHAMRGTRNARRLGGELEPNVRSRDTCLGSKVTHSGIGTDGVRVQQAENEQAQSQHAPQNRR